MCCKAASLVVIGIVLQLHWGLVEVAAIPGCNRSAAIACGQVAIKLSEATGCNWALVTPWYDSCITNATENCSTAEQEEVWRRYVTSFDKYLRGTQCNSECPDQQDRLEEVNIRCQGLNGGLDVISDLVLDNNAQPSDTVCTMVLQRTRDCLDAASMGCPIIADQAYNLMYTYKDAFEQCNIALPDRQPMSIEDIINAGGDNVFPSYKPDVPQSDGVSDLDATTQVVLYSVLGLCSLIIIGAGITALVICINRHKEKELKRKVERIREKNTVFEYPRRDLYPHPEEAPSGDIDFDDAASEESVGPYRPSGRWWTRPDFALGASRGPIDRQFRPWPGARPKEY